mgnify:CR=1 FL=1
MTDDTDDLPPEHLEFMNQMIENVKKMVGEDKMVAMLGEPRNGCYAVFICLNPLPPNLVLMTILSMLSEQMLKDMARRHNEIEMLNQGSSSVN